MLQLCIYTILPKVLGRPLLMNGFDYLLHSQKLITKHQWLVHMGTVILDTSKIVATEMEIKMLNTWIMFPSLLPQIWKCIFLF